jgi:hypothetical protein
VVWTKDLSIARAQSKAESKVIMIAINMDGERANDELVTDHYRDATLGKLAQHTINLFASATDHGRSSSCNRARGLACTDHLQLDRQVREQVLKVTPDTWVVAPQHLFVGPDGKLISAVPYAVTKGELEWVWFDAIQRLQPGFQWKLSSAARAPMRLRYGDGQATAGVRPPSDEEVKQLIEDLRRGAVGGNTGGGAGGRGGRGGNFMRMLENLDVILRSPLEDARDYGKEVLQFMGRDFGGLGGFGGGGRGGGGRGGAGGGDGGGDGGEGGGFNGFGGGGNDRLAGGLRMIGERSPAEWWEVVEPYLTDNKEAVREAAAEALEHLRAKEALPALRSALQKEKVARIKGRLLRAMAASAPDQKAVSAQVQKSTKIEKEEDARMHAAVAAALVDDGGVAEKTLSGALADKASRVRSGAAYGMAIRRDVALIPSLEAAHGAESDPETKRWMDAALVILRETERARLGTALAAPPAQPSAEARPATEGGAPKTSGNAAESGHSLEVFREFRELVLGDKILERK